MPEKEKDLESQSPENKGNSDDVKEEHDTKTDVEAGNGLELPTIATATSQETKASTTRDTDNLPPFFTCPLTKQLLQDPVVLADGISYERQAVLERDEVIMYPNRSLKAILTEFMASSGSSATAAASPTNTTPSVIPKPSLLQQAKRFFAAQEDRPLPDAFYCPITLGLMHKPVIDPQGYTYEGVAIYKWIENNGDSPVTRTPLTFDQLVPNHALEGLLEAEANRENAEDIHPAILKWKKESAVMVFDIPTVATTSNADSPAGIASTVVLFPTTPEELESQLAEARRQRFQKRLWRLSVIVLCILLIVAGFFVPILAAILLVFVILLIWFCMSSSTGSDYNI
ncbi:MAG: hypothetical protein SGILL_005917 [Bacillariaceae sp.]